MPSKRGDYRTCLRLLGADHDTQRWVHQPIGESESALISGLKPVFESYEEVRVAYLAGAECLPTLEKHVTLCLKTSGNPRRELIEEIGQVYQEMFSVREHMDIWLLNESQEAELMLVCSPVYVRAPR